ncbi:hypothetical protein C8R47DRAFT_1075181 [Mycena vitilis]|nr:hypothetical protein C8R47DRAFT_1075181 [Mycena vitilis]
MVELPAVWTGAARFPNSRTSRQTRPALHDCSFSTSPPKMKTNPGAPPAKYGCRSFMVSDKTTSASHRMTAPVVYGTASFVFSPKDRAPMEDGVDGGPNMGKRSYIATTILPAKYIVNTQRDCPQPPGLLPSAEFAARARNARYSLDLPQYIVRGVSTQKLRVHSASAWAVTPQGMPRGVNVWKCEPALPETWNGICGCGRGIRGCRGIRADGNRRGGVGGQVSARSRRTQEEDSEDVAVTGGTRNQAGPEMVLGCGCREEGGFVKGQKDGGPPRRRRMASSLSRNRSNLRCSADDCRSEHEAFKLERRASWAKLEDTSLK